MITQILEDDYTDFLFFTHVSYLCRLKQSAQSDLICVICFSNLCNLLIYFDKLIFCDRLRLMFLLSQSEIK